MRLDWGDVWAHALAADTAIALRVALDDSAAAVVTAAAKALAELVSAGSAGWGPLHAAAWQLPRVPARCLNRPHPAGAWTTLKTPRELFMVLQVLDRAAYLLLSKQAPGAVVPVLALLVSTASAGADGARAIVQTAGLVRSQRDDSSDHALSRQRQVLRRVNVSLCRCKASWHFWRMLGQQRLHRMPHACRPSRCCARCAMLAVMLQPSSWMLVSVACLQGQSSLSGSCLA